MILSIALQIIASIVTVAAIVTAGNKSVWGWILYLGSDVCFIVVNAYNGLWVLVAFILFVMVLHARNFLKWRKEIVRDN